MWWALTGCAWLDREPPTVTIEGPTEVVREAELVIRVVDPAPGVKAATVSIDGAAPIPLELPPDKVVRWRVPELGDGAHEIRVQATDASAFANVGQAAFTLTLDRTPPAIEIHASSLVAHQGKTWAGWVRSPEPLLEPVVKLKVMGKKPTDPPVDVSVPLYPVDGAWRALRGLEIEEPTGPHPLVVEARDALGNVAHVEATLDVQPTEFEVGGFIKLSKKQKEARKDEAAIKKMREERDAAYSYAETTQHWSGPFLLPIPEAELSSPFGKYRSYSDGKKSFHTGLDLSEPPGTPIGAAAAGVVVVAHAQAIFGNVVIVNHGQHVATSYNHLQEILVKEGDKVDAGAIVGLLGSTGQSTGPHLHWGLEVDVVAVDPGEWLGNGFDRSPWNPAPPPPVPTPPTADAEADAPTEP